MKLFSVVRIFGWVCLVLGIASSIMRVKFDMDTVLTDWMGQWQPWSGISMALVGAVCVVIGVLGGRKRSDSAGLDSE